MKGSSLVRRCVVSRDERSESATAEFRFVIRAGMTSIRNLVVSASDIVLSVSTADTYYADTSTFKTADGADSTFSGHRHSRPR